MHAFVKNKCEWAIQPKKLLPKTTCKCLPTVPVLSILPI